MNQSTKDLYKNANQEETQVLPMSMPQENISENLKYHK